MDASKRTLMPGMVLLQEDFGGRPMIWTVKSKYTLIGYSEGIAVTGNLTRKPGIPSGMVLLDSRKLAADLKTGESYAVR